jgi:hypothetical protein
MAIWRAAVPRSRHSNRQKPRPPSATPRLIQPQTNVLTEVPRRRGTGALQGFRQRWCIGRAATPVLRCGAGDPARAARNSRLNKGRHGGRPSRNAGIPSSCGLPHDDLPGVGLTFGQMICHCFARCGFRAKDRPSVAI